MSTWTFETVSHNILMVRPGKRAKGTDSEVDQELNGRAQRVVVGGIEFIWRSVNGIPKGPILHLVSFNLFIKNLEEGIECILNTFAANMQRESG